ncbi:hypothetical protein LX15_001130 [Streptoalloteichus tenebrarius]|uniref:Probable membrane transporter protein n=1 Tax=Streptoalloteichus tenebrarius (strain ATCC 17920 / DSM 40477 / JCM 4838 / CBS 697.72 / NBRC 16177 / NCIMB 11028 / NRRL B-12390 / A12253. 1 / ISP 5477) TaxID=1933 RepID=A0ABT1HPK7_STRSD|nr:sulfite exporter TauE/SafE family protein [Streptoalloteichus tenebrarius]MCP2257445.1 hypothetical protein [Streptoalloteichus tenebrarius]BFE98394.1 sulfite exporter TauE/SafE family protein [Streptoalloteichus tenebrarius]
MTWWQGLIVLGAGIWAGTINAVVGSGTLVTFPVLLALGFSPVTATTSNAVGLAPGTISAAIGYRHELKGQRARLVRYGVASGIGAIGGTVLLLALPHDTFRMVVPVLVGLALVLVVIQPRVSAFVTRRRDLEPDVEGHGGPLLLFLLLLVGVYGGYFTAAQGIMMMALMGMLLTDSMQRLNGIKNVLAAVVNVVAGLVYAVVAPVSWPVIALLAVGSTLGGLLGAKIGRLLSPAVLRGVIVVIGVAAIVQLLLR